MALTVIEQAQQVNQQPLNQEARKWLVQAIRPELPDETEPYSLQLAQWGVNQSLPVNEQGHPGISDSLPNLLRRLAKLAPQQQMNYLETGDPQPNPNPETSLSPSQLQQTKSPREAAQLILETLISHLIANQE